MKKTLAALSTFAAITMMMTACGGSSSNTDVREQSGSSLTPDGWTEIKLETTLRGWVAKTSLDSFGGFSTSWNPCNSAQSGALKDLTAWNKIVHAMNAAMKATPASQPICMPLEDTDRPIYKGTATAFPSKAQVQLIVDGGYHEVCTKITDQAIAKELISGLHQVQLEAEKEGCWNHP